MSFISRYWLGWPYSNQLETKAQFHTEREEEEDEGGGQEGMTKDINCLENCIIQTKMAAVLIISIEFVDFPFFFEVLYVNFFDYKYSCFATKIK